MGFVRKMWDGLTRFFTREGEEPKARPDPSKVEARVVDPEPVVKRRREGPVRRRDQRPARAYPKESVVAGAFGREACKMALADSRRSCLT